MCAQSWCPYVLRAAETPLNWEWTVQCPDPQTLLAGNFLLWEALGGGGPTLPSRTTGPESLWPSVCPCV